MNKRRACLKLQKAWAAATIATLALASLVAGCAERDATGDTGAAAVHRDATSAAPVMAGTRQKLPARLALGRSATRAEVAAWNIDVNPAGVGLPEGRGTYADGATLFRARCAVCHGAAGEGTGVGATAIPRLIGREPRDGFPFARDPKIVKTIGNYWPYPTTLYDYIHRAMPLDAPGSLSSDEVYSLAAFLLAENDIVARDAVMDRRTLPAVRMPARDRFVRDNRLTTSAFR